MDHQKFYEVAISFSTSIEAEHPGFGIIFSKFKNPTWKELVVTPEEELAIRDHPQSVPAIRAKKRIELFEAEEYNKIANQETVFAKTLKLCSPQLLTVLENEAGYEAIHNGKDPLLLWKLIRTVVTRGPASNSDPFEDRLSTIDRWRRFRQREDESVVDFRSRFDREVDVLYNRHITIGLVPLKLFPEADDTTPFTHAVYDYLIEHFSALDEVLSAREFIRKLDTTRYGDLQVQLSNDRAAGRDNYPTTTEASFNLAYQFRQKRAPLGKKQPAQQRQPHNEQTPQEQKGVEVGAGVALPTVTEQGSKPSKEEMFKQGLCLKCGQPGHIARNCPTKDNAKKKKVKFVGTHVGKNAAVASILRTDEDYDAGVAFPAVQKGWKLPESWILLDNQATISVFGDRTQLSNLRKCAVPMEVTGVGGSIVTDTVGDFGPFGTVYYHPQALGNILCFADVEDKFCIRYKPGVYTVRVNHTEYKFQRVGKLYVMDLNDTELVSSASNNQIAKASVLPIVTVQDNKIGFTQREIAKADEAVKLVTTLGFPSLKNVLHALHQGQIHNTGVTSKDVRRAWLIYGPPTASLMGKTKRSTPKSVESPDKVSVPATMSEVALCGDIFFVNGLSFFIAISIRLCLTTTKYLPDKKSSTLLAVVKATIAKYKECGFAVKEFRCDGEEALSGIADELRMLGIMFNATSKSEHEPVVERAIQTLKATARSIVNALPYRPCAVVVVYLVYYATSCVNMFPRKGGIGDLSPRQLVLGRPIDMAVEGRLPFGAFVHMHEDASSNGMEARTVGAIALGPCGNTQGGYRFLSLTSWRVVTRRAWTELPMPQEIIDLLNSKAKDEARRGGAPDGTLRFTLQGCPLPDEDVEAPDDNDEDITAELIADLRLVEPGAIEHTNPIETVERVDDNPDADVSTDDARSQPEAPSQMVMDANPNAESMSEEESTAEPPHDPPPSQDVTSYIPPHGYNTRYQRRVSSEYATVLLQLSGRSAVKAFGADKVAASQAKELSQLHDKGVWHPVHFAHLSNTHRNQILYSFCFTKEKRDGSLKCRLVSMGNKQNGPAFFGETIESSSPTVHNLAMNIVLAEIAEASRTHPIYVVTLDIEGVYLHADMPSDRYMSLDRDLSAILTTLYPSTYRPYLSINGRLCVKLDKALYGCVESAKLFHDHLSGTLRSMGMEPNPYDICVFNGTFCDHRVTIIVHVDDLLIWSRDRRAVDHTIAKLQETYNKITLHEGPKLDYLGIELDLSEQGAVYISAEHLVRETLAQYQEQLRFKAKTPALPDIFVIDRTSHLLSKEHQKLFHSTVAKLLYIAKHGRPDILTAVAFLTTRVDKTTEEDQRKLMRVLQYLLKYPALRVRITGGPGSLIKAYIDASYAVHNDGKSHSGIVITVGDGGPVHVSSKKQKLVAKSSTEAERIALGDELSPVLFAKHFREAQGYETQPSTVYQDNQSTITLAQKGRSTSHRTRHIAIRYFFVKDNIERGDITVEYKKTEDMLGDFFTKPLQGDLFRKMRDHILNTSQESN